MGSRDTLIDGRGRGMKKGVNRQIKQNLYRVKGIVNEKHYICIIILIYNIVIVYSLNG